MVDLVMCECCPTLRPRLDMNSCCPGCYAILPRHYFKAIIQFEKLAFTRTKLGFSVNFPIQYSKV